MPLACSGNPGRPRLVRGSARTRGLRAAMAAAGVIAFLGASSAQAAHPAQPGPGLVRNPPARYAAPSPPDPETASFVRRADAAALTGNDGTAACFGRQLEHVPEGARLATASVFLFVLSPDTSWRANGTGFVVADSATAGDSHRRMVTVAHVADLLARPEFKNGSILVVSSAGRMLGRARVVATSSHTYAAPGLAPSKGDVSVLSLVPLGVAPTAAYDRIAGLALASQQAGNYIPGFFGSKDTPGIWHGNSGGPVVGENGRAVGIVANVLRETGTASIDGHLWGGSGSSSRHQVVLASRNVLGSGGKVPGITRSALPRADIGLVHPLGDPAILDALGEAGRGVTETADAPSSAGSMHVWTAGYPAMGQCRVSEAAIGQAAEPLDGLQAASRLDSPPAAGKLADGDVPGSTPYGDVPLPDFPVR